MLESLPHTRALEFPLRDVARRMPGSLSRTGALEFPLVIDGETVENTDDDDGVAVFVLLRALFGLVPALLVGKEMLA